MTVTRETRIPRRGYLGFGLHRTVRMIAKVTSISLICFLEFELEHQQCMAASAACNFCSGAIVFLSFALRLQQNNQS